MRVCIRHVRSNHSLQNPKPRDNFSYKCEGHYIICCMMTLIIRGGKKFKYCPVVSIGGCPPTLNMVFQEICGGKKMLFTQPHTAR